MAGGTLMQHIVATAIVAILTGAAISLLIAMLGWIQSRTRVPAQPKAELKPATPTQPIVDHH